MVIFVKESLRSLKKLAILYYIVTQFNHIEFMEVCMLLEFVKIFPNSTLRRFLRINLHVFLSTLKSHSALP